MDSLEAFIRETKLGKFEPKPFYSKEGDAVTLYFEDEPSYRDRVDDFLTIYRSLQNDEMVGCQIKGIQNILKTLGDFGVSIRDKEVSLGLLFIGYLGRARLTNESTRLGSTMEKLGRVVGESSARFDTKELALA
jgi:hypothetical protein